MTSVGCETVPLRTLDPNLHRTISEGETGETVVRTTVRQMESLKSFRVFEILTEIHHVLSRDPDAR
jgi:hypothetical protein